MARKWLANCSLVNKEHKPSTTTPALHVAAGGTWSLLCGEEGVLGDITTIEYCMRIPLNIALE